MRVYDPGVKYLEVDVAPIPSIPYHEMLKTMCPSGQETVKAGLAVDMQPVFLQPSIGHAALPHPCLESLLGVCAMFCDDVKWFARFIVVV